jgi:hypothetical protein
MKRPIVIAASLVVLAACAERGAQPLGPAPSLDPGSVSPSPSASPTAGEAMTYEVWLNLDGSLFIGHRTEPFTPAVGRAALEALLDGPTPTETQADIGTTIVPGTTLLGLTIDDGVAVVNLDETFTSEETPAIAVGSLAQVVYTITQFRSVRAVTFEIEGSPLTNFGGYELDGAQRREDFADQLPLILVESPAIGDRVSSPVTIAGTADVFEAVVSIAILDADGRTVASTFTMATCGTGCRGTYSTDVRYDVDSTQPGLIRVFQVSAMDGSPTHVVEIPVTLAA